MDYLPGTTVEVNKDSSAKSFLDSAFMTGGLVLSQVVQLTGLEPHTIQNWVKRQFIAPPDHKKYGLAQFCRMAIINMLKDIFQIERIVYMLDYVRTADSGIDEAFIYIMLCDIMGIVPFDAIVEQTDIDGIIARAVDAADVSAIGGERLKHVLKILVLSSISARIRNRAELLLLEIEQD